MCLYFNWYARQCKLSFMWCIQNLNWFSHFSAAFKTKAQFLYLIFPSDVIIIQEFKMCPEKLVFALFQNILFKIQINDLTVYDIGQGIQFPIEFSYQLSAPQIVKVHHINKTLMITFIMSEFTSVLCPPCLAVAQGCVTQPSSIFIDNRTIFKQKYCWQIYSFSLLGLLQSNGTVALVCRLKIHFLWNM